MQLLQLEWMATMKKRQLNCIASHFVSYRIVAALGFTMVLSDYLGRAPDRVSQIHAQPTFQQPY